VSGSNRGNLLTSQTPPQSTLPKQRAAVIDLTIAIAFFLACAFALPTLDPILRRGRGLTGVLALAGYQLMCEGVVLLFIMAARHEHPSSYGFSRRRVGRSIGLALAMAGIYNLALSWRAGALLWIPLRRHSAMRMSLAAGFPSNLVGLAITIAVWGLMEAFFGVFFARKVNDALGHSGRGWLSYGAIGFGLFNGLIHFALGQGIEGFVTCFASGYAIAVIPAVTENAWGSAVVQTLTNAAGKL
jgi:hypothetical protein